MDGPKQMVAGFNHNVKHRGKAYHVQTEDSGLSNPRIITHLFHGGNILASKKTSYADILGAENLAEVVRELMEEQHKEMLRNLVNGVYEDVERAFSAQSRVYQPGQLDTDSAPSPADPREGASAGARPPEPPPFAMPEVIPPELTPAAPVPRPEFVAPVIIPPAAPAAPAPRAPPARSPAPVRARARAPSAPVPSAPRSVSPAPAAQPREALFGEDLISERSLDEVILSFLAEDKDKK
ncbi:MAG TPA: hypothetical protein VMK12_26060 [Anaeromyxobacteraceae bacterium]|nr:hypothetical protein [Anaeromyxobacteraceae bacterium]